MIALLLTLLVGVSLGALGSGGSIVTLPILVYVAGIAPKAAVGMSMVIVGATSLFGSYFHWRNGNLHSKAALLFIATGIPGAYLGSLGTHLISSSALMLLFAALMILVGVRMLTGKQSTGPSMEKCSPSRCIPAGFAVGLLTGFLGVGGGFLIVPALVWFAGLDAKRAIGTSLAIIAANSASGLAGQLHYIQFDGGRAVEFAASALIGMGLGVPIASRSPERALRRGFAVLVLTVAAAIGWQVLGFRR